MSEPIREPLPPSTERPRDVLLSAIAVLVFVCVLLLAESLLPGRLFLPLAPDDFPEWQAGRDPASLQRHPHPNWCMSDVLHLFVPGLAVNAAAAARGELPLWDDSQALGVPHLHEVHYGVFYPPAWLPVLLGFHGLAWMALLHLLVAAIGTLVYLNAIGRSRAAALAGACCFAFSAWISARLHAFPVVGAAVWLPWVLWGLERGSQRGGVRYRIAAAAALALSFFAGFPQISLWVLFCAGLLELARAVAAARRGRPALRTLLIGLASLLFGIALALPQILPTLDYLRSDSMRDRQSPDVVAAEALPAPLLWQLLVPDRYASAGLTGAHPVALGAMKEAQNPAALNRAETSMGVGALGLLLALLAMIFGRGWRTMTFSLLVLAVFTVLLWPALLSLAASVMPLLRFGNPKRLLLLSTFALSVLAAGGLDLARGKRIGVTVAAWVLALLFAVLGLISRLTVPSAELPGDITRWAQTLATDLKQPGLTAKALSALVPDENFRIASSDAATSSLLAIGVAVIAILMFRPRQRPTLEGWNTRARRMPWLLVLVMAAELGASAFPLLRSLPAEDVTNRPDKIGWLRAPALAALLRTAREPGQDVLLPPRIARLGDNPSWLRPNFPGLFGLTDLQCYAPMAPRRLTELLRALDPDMVSNGSALGGLQRKASLESPLLDLLDVRAVLTTEAGLAPDGWHESGHVGPVRVLQNDAALPRAFVAARTEVVTDSGQRVQRLLAADFQPRLTALLATPLPVELPAPADDAAGLAAPRPVTVEAWSPGAIRLRVGPGEPGLLVVSEAFHSGWRAHVAPRAGADGAARAAAADADVPVVPADHALLALPLQSRYDLVVTLRFQPPLVPYAMLAGGALWLVALALFVLGTRGVRPGPRLA